MHLHRCKTCGEKGITMKKAFFVLILCLTVLLCGCGMSEGSIIGVWSGSGTVGVLDVDIEEEVVPLETWTFLEDGTAMLEVCVEEALPVMAFTYTFQNGILTLQADGRSVEIPCQQAGDTLVFSPEGKDSAVFSRAG